MVFVDLDVDFVYINLFILDYGWMLFKVLEVGKYVMCMVLMVMIIEECE